MFDDLQSAIALGEETKKAVTQNFFTGPKEQEIPVSLLKR
jgi:hypothetical protein